MGRKSIAEKIYEEVKEDYKEEEEVTWLVIYDFLLMKGNSRFWSNVNRVSGLVGEGFLIQNSVYKTTSKIGAITVLNLAKHYGAEAILYIASEVDI